MKNASHAQAVQKIKTNILSFNNVFPKILSLSRYVEKLGTAQQTTDDNMAQAHCMLGT
jgi:hypothetical protein